MITIFLYAVWDFVRNGFSDVSKNVNMFDDMGFSLNDVIDVTYVQYNRSNKDRKEHKLDLPTAIKELKVFEKCNRHYVGYVFGGGSVLKLTLSDQSTRIISISNTGNYVGYDCSASTFAHWYFADNNPLSKYATTYRPGEED